MPIIASQVFIERYIGAFRPIIMIVTMAAMPTMVATHTGALRRYTKKPKTMAIRINKTEIVAAIPLVLSLSPLAAKPLKVPATMEANAATTKRRVR